MTLRVDRTLPHHAALGLVLYTEPRRRPTLDDRTPDQVRRNTATDRRAPLAGGTHTHLHHRGTR